MNAARLAVLLLATITAAHAQDRTTASSNCPDVSGRYRVTGSKYVVEDALRALGARPSGFKEDDILLSGRPEDGVGVSIAGGGRDMPASPDFVLRHGATFLCKDGWLVFNRIPNARRETGKGWYQGESVVRIRASGGELNIDIAFTGRQSATILQYETPLNVPKPFSGASFHDTLLWPGALGKSRPASEGDRPSNEPREVLEVRAMLSATVMGNVTLGTLQPSGDAVLASLSARDNDDIARFEDRMRAASIRYVMKQPPRWTGTRYGMDLRVWPANARGAPAVRPSAHRVEQELLRSHLAMISVRKVDDVGDGYVATLSIPATASIESVIAGFKTNTKLFADIRPLNESPPVGTATLRVAQIKLWLR
jgi:hypothetical protein